MFTDISEELITSIFMVKKSDEQKTRVLQVAGHADCLFG
jgi:hypothetical protein